MMSSGKDFPMKRITFLILCCLWLLVAASTCFAQMYTVTDLGTLGGTTSTASGINAFGQVAGTSYTATGLLRPFRTASNRPIDPLTDAIDCGGPLLRCRATGINDSGQVVGETWVVGEDWVSFRTGGNGSDSVEFIPLLFGRAWGINNSGQVVIFSLGESGNTPSSISGCGGAGCSYRTGDNGDPDLSHLSELGTLAPGGWDPHGAGWTVATAINDSGEVVGWSDIGDKAPEPGTRHAFRTAPNSRINPLTDDLGTLGGSPSSATHINAFGQVVGWSYIAGDAAIHAFRTAPNSPIDPTTDDLGTLGGSYSSAKGIDSYGHVVGSSTTGDTAQHAFLYSSGVMYDLNKLIPAGSGCELVESVDINDAGQIAANGDCGHAFLLTPALTVSPRIIDFGTVYLKSVVLRTVTLKNAGTVAAQIGRISLTIPSGDSDEFIFLSFCGKSLKAGKSCTIAVFFYADDVATDTATLNIGTNAPYSPLQVPMTATVVKRHLSASHSGR
jgi:probable HAF family extracellular repeat protein